jgi:UDP-glucose 4-epimerase
MRVLITGSTGFIGRNLKEYFQERGYQINCPGRADLNLLDSDAIREYFTRNSIDVVIHCGITLTSVEENLKMYFNLERCSDLYSRMICVGSAAEFDMRNYAQDMTEDYFRKFIPTDIYGFSKYVVAKDIESNKADILNLRVWGIFGKYEDHSRRFISNNIGRALSGLNISMNINMAFDYLYVNDFARIVEMFLDNSPKHKIYNTCVGTPVDMQTLAEVIRDVHGQDVPIVVKEEGRRAGYTGDNSLFQNEFGPFEFTDIRTSVSELYDWYVNSSGIEFRPEMFE